jgi:tripartite-type tricarboxylate transporter receptor subunit TctC
VLASLIIGLAVTSATPASAQAYPSKPIRFIVPYPAGGGVDILARMVAPRLSERLGQQVVIDNRGGAGGNIGTELASRALPDGYTLMMGAAALAINMSLYDKLPFDPVKDFQAVSLLAATPNLVTVHPSVPAQSMREFLALAQRQKDGMNYASAGNGTTSHLAAELLKVMAKVPLTHVPYKGTTPAVVALLSGEVPLMLAPALTVLPHVHAGKVRALAITSTKRSEALPELPTVSESGVRGYEANQWYGVLVPAGTPAAIVAQLNREIGQILRQPEVTQRLAKEGSIALGGTPDDFAAYLKAEIAKWSRVVKLSGARVD